MSLLRFIPKNTWRGVVILAVLLTLAIAVPGQRLNTRQVVPSWASGPNDTEIPTQYCMDTASFLAGLKGRAESPFHALEETASWKAYAEHRIVCERQPKLLLQFAQACLKRRLAGIAASARQGPLRAMGTQARGAAGQEEGGLGSLAATGERDRDRCALQPGC